MAVIRYPKNWLYLIKQLALYQCPPLLIESKLMSAKEVLWSPTYQVWTISEGPEHTTVTDSEMMTDIVNELFSLRAEVRKLKEQIKDAHRVAEQASRTAVSITMRDR